jgi:Phage P22-like portal protein
VERQKDSDKDLTIVQLARKRYDQAKDFYAKSREYSNADIQFCYGDTRNGLQYPDHIRKDRDFEREGYLTVNATYTNVKKTTNSIRMNRPQGKVIPADGAANKDIAEVLAKWCRSVQSYSNADDAHDHALEYAAMGGEGYWEVCIEHESPESFKEVAKIRLIDDFNSVLIDPNAKDLDKSDAEWGFIEEEIPKSTVYREHPGYDPESWETDLKWVNQETVVRAKYYYCEYKPDTLEEYIDGTTGWKSQNKGLDASLAPLPTDIGDEAVETVPDYEGMEADNENTEAMPDNEGMEVDNEATELYPDETVEQPQYRKQVAIDTEGKPKTRKSYRKQWYCCLLLGGEEKPVEKREWPGNMLPIVGTYGESYRESGQVLYKGEVRNLIDPNRILNYAYTAAVKSIALQNNVPWTIPLESVEGIDAWETANTENHAYLPFREYDQEGRQLSAPRRESPPITPAAHLQLLQVSLEQMQTASGQFASPGQHAKDTSGIAMERKNAEAEVATFHYPDNLSRALRYEMAILVDLAPYLLAEGDLVRLMNIDGTEEMAKVQPNMQQGYMEANPKAKAQGINHIFNPNKGKYDVAITTGPSYQTKRLEDADRIVDMVNKNPNLWMTHPDLIAQALDFTNSEAWIERFKKTMQPGIIDEEGQEPVPPQIQQQMQQYEAHIQELQDMADHAKMEIEQMQAEMQKKDLAVTQAQAKAAMSDVDAKQTASLLAITKAAHSLAVKSMVPKEEPVEEAGSDEIDPDTEALLMDNEEIKQKLSDMADNFSQFSQMLAQSQAALLESINRPRVSKLEISKDAQGNYVGQKVEMPDNQTLQ